MYTPPTGTLNFNLRGNTIPGAYLSFDLGVALAELRIVASTGHAYLSCSIVAAPLPVCAPKSLFPSYTFDGQNISIGLRNLHNLPPESAHPVTGNWGSVVQALLLSIGDYLADFPVTQRLTTSTLFMLEDWNRNNAKFGRHMKRLFLVEFTVENSPTNVFNSGE